MSSIEPTRAKHLTFKEPTPHANYYGGKVLTQPRFQSLYLGEYWAGGIGSRDRKYLDRFANSLVTGPHTSIWQQYGAGKGTFVGSTISKAPSGTKTVNERTIERIITGAINAKQAVKPDGQTVYTIFLAPGTVLTDADGGSSQQGVGGYHGSFIAPNGKAAYYAAVVYSEKGNGVRFAKTPLDNVTIAASHEWSETVTDPDVNRSKLGWYDNNYGEIGDIPISSGDYTTPIFERLDGFAVQKEWSNKDQRSEVIAQEP